MEDTHLQLEGPHSQIENTESHMEVAHSHIDGPDSHIEGPDSHIESPHLQMEDTDSHIVIAHSQIEVAHSHIHDTHSHMQDEDLQMEDADSHMEDAGSQMEDTSESARPSKHEKHECDQCLRRFTSKAHLDQHTLQHSHDQGYMCEECGVVFGSRGTLKRHSNNIHLGIKTSKKTPKRHLCEECGLAFISNDRLVEHQDIHLGIKRYQCDLCDDRWFRQRGSYYQHLRRKHDIIPERINAVQNRGLPAKCNVCGKEVLRLKEHQKIHQGIKNHQCHICQRSFRFRYTLRNHMTLHTGDSKFECPDCNKKFVTRGTLNTHRLLHEEKRVRQKFTCTICNKVYTKKCTLEQHMISHTGIKKYSCDECDYGFTMMSTLRAHKKLHAARKQLAEGLVPQGVQIYPCNSCDKIFLYKASMIAHQSSHTGQKNYKCPICPKKYASKYSFTNHIKLHVKGLFGEKKGTLSKQKRSLGKQKRTYSKKKRALHGEYACTRCDNVYVRQNSLDHHMFSHAGVTVYECKQCRRVFLERCQLQIHKLSHSTNKSGVNIDNQKSAKISESERIGSGEELNENKAHGDIKISPKIEEIVLPVDEDDSENKDVGWEINLADPPTDTNVIQKSTVIKNEEIHNKENSNSPSNSDNVSDIGEPCADNPAVESDGDFTEPQNILAQGLSIFENKVFECSECCRSYQTKQSLEVHMLRHRGVKKHECQICSKKFVVKFCLERHMRIHAKDMKFDCRECGLQFDLKSSFKKHVLIHQKESLSCYFCSMRFTQKPQLTRHLEIHTNTQKSKSEKFEICENGKGSSQVNEEIHAAGDRCDKVDAPARTSRTPKSTEYSESEGNGANKTDSSQTCSKSKMSDDGGNDTEPSVDQHTTEADNKNHSSDDNDGDSAKPHSSTNIPLECEECGRHYQTKESLKVHQLNHQVKEHECHICSRSFTFRYLLTRHLRSHSKEQRYECQECGLRFGLMGNLKKHVLIHKRGSHKCEFCGVGFSKASEMIRHLVSHIRAQKSECESPGNDKGSLQQATYVKDKAGSNNDFAESPIKPLATDDIGSPSAESGDDVRAEPRSIPSNPSGKTYTQPVSNSNHSEEAEGSDHGENRPGIKSTKEGRLGTARQDSLGNYNNNTARVTAKKPVIILRSGMTKPNHIKRGDGLVERISCLRDHFTGTARTNSKQDEALNKASLGSHKIMNKNRREASINYLRMLTGKDDGTQDKALQPKKKQIEHDRLANTKCKVRERDAKIGIETSSSSDSEDTDSEFDEEGSISTDTANRESDDDDAVDLDSTLCDSDNNNAMELSCDEASEPTNSTGNANKLKKYHSQTQSNQNKSNFIKLNVPCLGQKKFNCSQCDRKFYSEQSLRHHKETHDVSRIIEDGKSKATELEDSKNKGTKMEKEKQVTPNTEAYQIKISTAYRCYICDQDFSSKKDLIKHQEFHAALKLTIPIKKENCSLFEKSVPNVEPCSVEFNDSENGSLKDDCSEDEILSGDNSENDTSNDRVKFDAVIAKSTKGNQSDDDCQPDDPSDDSDSEISGSEEAHHNIRNSVPKCLQDDGKCKSADGRKTKWVKAEGTKFLTSKNRAGLVKSANRRELVYSKNKRTKREGFKNKKNKIAKNNRETELIGTKKKETELQRSKRKREAEVEHPKNKRTQFAKKSRTELEGTKSIRRVELIGAKTKRKQFKGFQNKRTELEGSKNKRTQLEGSKNQQLEGSRTKKTEFEGSQNKRRQLEGSKNKRRQLEGSQNKRTQLEGSQIKRIQLEGSKNKRTELGNNIKTKLEDFKDKVIIIPSESNPGVSQLNTLPTCDGERLKCEACGREFTKRRLFDKHLLKHQNEEYEGSKEWEEESNLGEIVCSRCGEVGSILAVGETKYTCSLCESQSPQVQSVDEKFLNCSRCDKKFNTERGLKHHQSAHERRETNKKNIDQKKPLAKNKKNIDQKKPLAKNLTQPTHAFSTTYVCIVCDESFSSRGSLNTHKHIHQVKITFVCNICCKVYSLETDLVQHQLTHKDEGLKTCQSNKKTLIQHQLKDADLKEHQFNKTDLVQHELTHKDKGLKTCQSNKKTLIQHQLKHTDKTKDADLKEHESNKTDLAQHQVTLKKETTTTTTTIDTSPKQYQYQCNQCEFQCNRKSALSRHNLNHEEDRFSCVVCGATFPYRRLLNQHKQMHQDANDKSNGNGMRGKTDGKSMSSGSRLDRLSNSPGCADGNLTDSVDSGDNLTKSISVSPKATKQKETNINEPSGTKSCRGSTIFRSYESETAKMNIDTKGITGLQLHRKRASQYSKEKGDRSTLDVQPKDTHKDSEGCSGSVGDSGNDNLRDISDLIKVHVDNPVTEAGGELHENINYPTSSYGNVTEIKTECDANTIVNDFSGAVEVYIKSEPGSPNP